jgi:hypothetical protein
MGAVFSAGFYGGPFHYLWGPFSILSAWITLCALTAPILKLMSNLGPISQRTEKIFLWAENLFLWRVAL